jgi:hypothetical protein
LQDQRSIVTRDAARATYIRRNLLGIDRSTQEVKRTVIQLIQTHKVLKDKTRIRCLYAVRDHAVVHKHPVAAAPVRRKGIKAPELIAAVGTRKGRGLPHVVAVIIEADLYALKRLDKIRVSTLVLTALPVVHTTKYIAPLNTNLTRVQAQLQRILRIVKVHVVEPDLTAHTWFGIGTHMKDKVE